MEVINKFYSHNFEIKNTWEAGIVLSGPEVKACKKGQVNFKGAYGSFEITTIAQSAKSTSTLFIKNFYIAPYELANREQSQYNPWRQRKLLLKRKELTLLFGWSATPGATIIPLRLYTRKRLVKIEIALAYGLKKYDKREKLKRRDFERQKQRLLKIKS